MCKTVISIVCFISFWLHAQTDSVAYSKDFVFKDGLYIYYEQFRSNNPVPVSSIIYEYDHYQLDFLDVVTSKREISYFDMNQKEQKMITESLWGYCRNGIVYINFNGDFNRVPVIGSLCHFTANVMVTDYQTNPGYSYSPPVPIHHSIIIQYMLDTEKGSVLEFNTDNMESFLKRDDLLYKEFSGLKKRQKREAVFLYLRKYNEKHPLYFVLK